ncbi:MAG: O-antigen ligase family protein [Anaerolineaceae bacterium]|nr:O-antigen ligase family protein [Anaerolineaceae bacterium]
MRKLISIGFGWLDRYTWILLACSTPVFLFPAPQRSWGLLVIPILWMITFLAGKKPILPSPLNGCLLVLSMMVLVSLYATYDIAFSLPNISGILFGLAVYFEVVRRCSQPTGWQVGIGLFLLSGLGIAGMGLIGTTWVTEKFAWMVWLTSRLPHVFTGAPETSEAIHPNILAGALLWVLPLYLSLTIALFSPRSTLLFKGNRFRKSAIPWAFLLVDLSLLGLFFLTQSRDGYLALAVMSLILLLVALPSRGRIALSVLIVLGGVSIAGWLLIHPSTNLLQAVTGSPTAANPALSLNSLEARVEIWSRAIYGIQDFPFTGMGMNTFRRVVQVLYPLFRIGPDVDIGHAHNEFLQVALDLGVPGLIAFLGICLLAFWMAIHSWRRLGVQEGRGIDTRAASGYRLQKWIALGLLGGFGAHFLFGLLDAISLGTKPGIVMWILLGLIAGLYHQMNEEPDQAGAEVVG